MKKLIILVLLLCTSNALCQDWGASPENYVAHCYDWYGIKISIPNDANATIDNIAWKHNVGYNNTLGGLFSLTVNWTNKECIIMFPIVVDRLIKTGVNSSVDGYMGSINREVLQSFDILDEDLKMRYNYAFCYNPGSHLTTISGNEVRSSTNADKICFYTLDCKEGMFRNTRGKPLSFVPEKYSKIIRVFFLKEGGYHFDALLLMTDEAYKNKAEQLSLLIGMINFDEAKIKEVWDHTECAKQ